MARLYPVQRNNAIVKEYMRSGAVFARGLMAVLYVCLFITLNLGAGDFFAEVARRAAGASADQNAVQTGMTATMIAIFVATIPMLLLAIAYFIIYFKSRNEDRASQPDAGLTMLNIFAVIEMICTILATVGGIAASVILTIHEYTTHSTTSRMSTVSMFLNMGATVLACVILMIIAIVYRVYIGSINTTAKTTELKNNGAKAFGVFSVIRAIGGFFTVLATAGALILFKRLPEFVTQSNGDANAMNVAMYVAEKGLPIIILLMLIAIVTFISYILDAKIALGYNNHIKDVRYGLEQQEYQQPYGGQQSPRRDYTDRYIDGDNYDNY